MDAPSPSRSEQESRFARQLLASWFSLTTREQTAVLVLLFLFLLGIAVKWWHVRHGQTARHPPAPALTRSPN